MKNKLKKYTYGLAEALKYSEDLDSKDNTTKTYQTRLNEAKHIYALLFQENIQNHKFMTMLKTNYGNQAITELERKISGV